jgi:Zn-finger nucleic acid-binding protein
MATLSCPTCAGPLTSAGRTDRCSGCDGAWIHEDVLVGMLQEMASALVELPWQPRVAEVQRPCAVCQVAMAPVCLGHVALDRCARHGVWFDAAELAALLGEAKQFKVEAVDEPADTAHHHGLLGALSKLFVR